MSHPIDSNRPLRISATVLALGALVFTGCAAQGAAPDDAVGESHGTLVSAQSTYYTFRPDYRRCAYPDCGGAWVGRVNRNRTRCADGTRATECYVANVDWSALGLGDDALSSVREASGVLFRGEIESNVVRDRDYGRFAPTEAWVPATDAEPAGDFWRMQDNGVRCITEPCFSLIGHRLNRRQRGTFSGMDLTAIRATDDQLSAAYVALGTEDGMLVAGNSRWRWTWTDGWVRGFDATQFYLRAMDSESGCVVSGCSSQICGDEARITTCEWNDEYACYRDATCERQADGACGWTETEELTACIDDARVQVCGTRGALPCDSGSFCDFPEASICGRADGPGTCEPRPDFCTREYAPVCGCDGETYSNACTANAAGVSVEADGACCAPGPHVALESEIEGDWNGPGEWEIHWTFNLDGTFTKSDLVAPCPEGTVCIWSGIVTNRGRWSVSGTDLVLTYDSIDTSFGVTQPSVINVTTTCEHLVLFDGERYYER